MSAGKVDQNPYRLSPAMPSEKSPISPLVLRQIAARADAEVQAQEDWEEAIKPTTVSAIGNVRQLGGTPLQARALLSNTTAGAGVPIAGVGIPGGVVGDWVPRIAVEEPVEVRKTMPPPPGNWAVVFDFTWIGDVTIQQNQATAFATALLKLIGADVAGSFQYRITGSLLYTRQAFVNAANALGIEMIEDQLFMVGSLTLDCPFVGTFPIDGDTLTQARDRVARWGGVVLSDSSPDIPSRFMRAMQVATPEAQLLMPGIDGALVDYYDTGAPSVPMVYLDQSPFTAGEIGHSVVLFNRPRLTRDSTPVFIPDVLYRQLPANLKLTPYRSKYQPLHNPKPIGQIITGVVTGYGGFFNQAHTEFPNPIRYTRVR